MGSTVERGRHAERMAAAFLVFRGYSIRDRNVRLGPLELDLVAEKDGVLVIVEVKYRAGTGAVGAAEAVGPLKIRRLETAAVRYLRRSGIRDRSVRFDVVLVELQADGDALVLRHLRGAFPATGRYRG